jgi:hypothetical protein
VRTAAEAALPAFIDVVNPYSVEDVLDHVFEGMSQVRVGVSRVVYEGFCLYAVDCYLESVMCVQGMVQVHTFVRVLCTWRYLHNHKTAGLQ